MARFSFGISDLVEPKFKSREIGAQWAVRAPSSIASGAAAVIDDVIEAV
jgi:hypothetical protein